MDKTKKEIMEATYRTLCEVGFKDATMERIAENFDKSKSLILYHYNTKAEVMKEFTNYLEEILDSELEKLESEDPKEELARILDLLFCQKGDEMYNFHLALFELRGQTPHKEEIREAFDHIDRKLQEKFTEITGRMGFPKPEIKGELLLSAIYGIIARSIQSGDRDYMLRMKENVKSLFLEI